MRTPGAAPATPRPFPVDGGDHAGDVGAVAVRVDATVTVAHEIETREHDARQVLVVTAHAGVDDRDDRRRAPSVVGHVDSNDV